MRISHRSLLSITVCACLIVMGKNVSASDYYVSQTGSNSNDGKSPDAAFSTLQHAHNQTSPGDVVHIMNGTYSAGSNDVLLITRSGSAGKPITYRAHSGHHPKIVVKKSYQCWAAIRVNASHLVIDGIELMGDNDNITLAEGEARHDHYLANKSSGTVNWGYMAVTNTNGIYIKGDNTHTGPVHVTVRNCLVHKFPGGGISAEISDYITIENNIVHSNAWYMIYAGSGISVFHPWNSDGNTSTYRNIVRKNRVYNNETRVKWADKSRYSDGNGIIIDDNKNNQISKAGADSGKLSRLNYTGKTLVTTNVSYGNGGCGINVFSSRNVDVVQNTLYDNSASPHLNWPDLEINADENVGVYNNIAYATRDKAFGLINSVNVKHDFNLYFNGSAAVGGSHNITGSDPKFAGKENGDFKLLAGSPAIDNGTNTPASDTDFDGTVRPQGSGIDRGAYEFRFPTRIIRSSTRKGALNADVNSGDSRANASLTASKGDNISVRIVTLGGRELLQRNARIQVGSVTMLADRTVVFCAPLAPSR